MVSRNSLNTNDVQGYFPRRSLARPQGKILAHISPFQEHSSPTRPRPTPTPRVIPSLPVDRAGSVRELVFLPPGDDQIRSSKRHPHRLDDSRYVTYWISPCIPPLRPVGPPPVHKGWQEKPDSQRKSE